MAFTSNAPCLVRTFGTAANTFISTESAIKRLEDDHRSKRERRHVIAVEVEVAKALLLRFGSISVLLNFLHVSLMIIKFGFLLTVLCN